LDIDIVGTYIVANWELSLSQEPSSISNVTDIDKPRKHIIGFSLVIICFCNLNGFPTGIPLYCPQQPSSSDNILSYFLGKQNINIIQ